MKGRVVVLSELNRRPMAALFVDGKLEDLLVDPDVAHRPGEICRGKIERIVKGGAFVALPKGHGYLRGGNFKQGHSVLVQVTGYAEGGKAIPLTDKLVLKGKTVIVTPSGGGMNLSRQIRNEDERLRLFSAIDTYKAATTSYGIVARTAAVQAETKDIEEEVDHLIDQADTVLEAWKGEPNTLVAGPDAHDLARREWVQDGDWVTTKGEEHGVADEIDALGEANVSLSQGSMTIEATRALVAVDINTGGDFSPAAGVKTNIAAARELPRQLRLRGLGGQVILDPAPMPKKDRRVFEDALKAAFRKDSVETSLVGWTRLGLFEIQRKRERPPLI